MLDAVLASTPVVALTDSGRVAFLTPRAADLLGRTQEAAEGMLFAEMLEDSDLPSDLDPARFDERVWCGRRPDGQACAVALTVSSVADAASPHRFMVTLSDLSRLRSAGEQARDLDDQLNRVWRLNSLGEMAACLAHELNQPLGAATNYLHAARSDLAQAAPGSDTVRSLDLAKAQLLRAGAIIRRMRELLSHESRGLGAENVRAMVGDMEGLLAMLTRGSSVRIEIAIAEGDDRVQAERIQIQQAIVNLVRNAVEALDGRADGQVVVRGRTISDTEYEIGVEDNGPGIAPADLDRILSPLTTTKDGGMGLGLSVTRTIVEAHGGMLSVRASDLGGAAVCFNLMRDVDLEDA